MKSKVALVHPQLRYGGSEATLVQTIEALKDRYDVSLITGGAVSLTRINEYYQTNIKTEEISILRAPLPFGLGDTAKFAALRGHIVERYCQRVAPQFDLLINTYGPCDFGVPAIQCIADLAFVEEWRNSLHPVLVNHRRWWYGNSPLRRAYLKLCDSISHSDPESWKRNLTLANSRWTATLLRKKLGIESQFLYPPVVGDCPVVPWKQRENGFVCIGRIVPERRMDVVIRILEKVRQQGHDVHLHILGGTDDSPFGKKLKALAGSCREWVFLEGRTFGQKKMDLVAMHRFGINGRENEPFGIASAETVKAGCITFVPNGGGQTEIVGHPMLTFNSEEDATGKIATVLSNVALQEILRRHLAEQARKFSVGIFQTSIREIVFEFLRQKEIAPQASLVR